MALIVKIRVDDKGNAAIIDLGKNAQAAKQKVDPLGISLNKIFGVAATWYGLGQLKDGIVGLGDEVAKFDLNMKKVEGIGGMVGKSLSAVNKTARDLATTTEFSASKISDAMLEVIKMGFQDPESVAAAMPDILNLATSATMDLNYAATNTISTLMAFNLKNSEVGRVANVAATALNNTALNAEDYMEAMKYIAPVANNVNISLEETSSMLGALAQAGIKGSMAGTTLRSILLNILQPSAKVSKGLKQMNLEGKSLGEILSGLSNQGLNIIDFLNTFDKTAITGTMVLANPEIQEALKKLDVSLVNQEVKSKDVSATIRTALIPSYQMMINTLNEVALSVFDAFGDRPQDVLSGITDQLKQLDNWVDFNQDKIKKTADAFLNLVSIVASFSTGALTVLIEDFNNLSKIVIALIGVKALGAIPGIFTEIEKKATAMALGSKWADFTTSVNLGIVALTATDVLLTTIINKKNQILDERTKSAADLSEAATRKRRDAAFSIYSLYQEIADMQKQQSKVDINDIDNLSFYTGRINDLKFQLYDEKRKYKESGYMESEVSSLERSRKAVEMYNAELSRFNKTKEETSKQSKVDLSAIKEPRGRAARGGESRAAQELGIFKLLNEQRQEYYDSNEDGSGLHKTVGFDLNDYINDEYDPSEFIRNIEEAINEGQKEFQDNLYERTKENLESIAKEVKKATESMTNSYWSMGESTTDIIETISQKQSESTIKRLEDEKEAISASYDAQINAASGNAFKKEMIEQRKAQAEIKVNQKIEAAKRAADKRQKVIDNAKATADMIKSIIGTIADTQGGPITRAAAGVSIGAISAGYLAELIAINYRSGSKGLIEGDGNSTSDSIRARLSKGERVLSVDEIDAMGGNERIQQTIDRGSTYNKNSNVSITVGTIIGTKQYVRDVLLPDIKRELKR